MRSGAAPRSPVSYKVISTHVHASKHTPNDMPDAAFGWCTCPMPPLGGARGGDYIHITPTDVFHCPHGWESTAAPCHFRVSSDMSAMRTAVGAGEQWVAGNAGGNDSYGRHLDKVPYHDTAWHTLLETPQDDCHVSPLAAAALLRVLMPEPVAVRALT